MYLHTDRVREGTLYGGYILVEYESKISVSSVKSGEDIDKILASAFICFVIFKNLTVGYYLACDIRSNCSENCQKLIARSRTLDTKYIHWSI